LNASGVDAKGFDGAKVSCCYRDDGRRSAAQTSGLSGRRSGVWLGPTQVSKCADRLGVDRYELALRRRDGLRRERHGADLHLGRHGFVRYARR